MHLECSDKVYAEWELLRFLRGKLGILSALFKRRKTGDEKEQVIVYTDG